MDYEIACMQFISFKDCRITRGDTLNVLQIYVSILITMCNSTLRAFQVEVVEAEYRKNHPPHKNPWKGSVMKHGTDGHCDRVPRDHKTLRYCNENKRCEM